MKNTGPMANNREIELSGLQLYALLGPSWEESIELMLTNIYCGCHTKEIRMVDHKAYLDGFNDIILRGNCSACQSKVARVMETGEREGIDKIAASIRKLNRK